MKRMVDTKAVALIEAMQKAGIDTESISNTIAVLSGSKEVDDYYEAEGDITISNLPTNISSNFAHWRISNGKLSVVLSFYALAGTYELNTNAIIGSIEIPEWAFDKIIPVIQGGNATNRNIMNLIFASGSVVQSLPICVTLDKDSTNKVLRIYFTSYSSQTLSGPAIGRIEFNFTL